MPKAINGFKVCSAKDCRWSGRPQPVANFSKALSPDGYRYDCRPCVSQAQKKARARMRARNTVAAPRSFEPPTSAPWDVLPEAARDARLKELLEFEITEQPASPQPDQVAWRGPLEAPVDFGIPPPLQQEEIPKRLQKLVAIARKAPIAFPDLCDRLDMAPGKVRTLLEECAKQELFIKVEGDLVGFKPADEGFKVQTIGGVIPAGEEFICAAISDTHLGSRYCLRAQLQDFVHYAYEQGARHILHPGDITDGQYAHGQFEVSHVGLDEQVRDLYETLPQLDGLTYHAIGGNHDFTFTEKSGVDVPRFIVNYFKERNRHDFFAYGNRGAFLRLGGAVVHLWHPRSGVSYARSYALQKHIEKYASGEKPHLMLAGHWHVYCHVYERGVHALACPTFQGGGSAFSKSLGGAPAIGGMVFRWRMTEHGTMRTFVHEYRAYFEHEKPQTLFEGRSE